MEKPIESHKYLMGLKRKNKITIREMSRSMGITLIRIRFVLANGVSNHYELRDWVQAITNRDPGNMESFRVTYRNPKTVMSTHHASHYTR